MTPETDWHKQARCREEWVEPEWFFIDTGSATRARKVCALCPVRSDCLDFALHNPLGQHGIWGGTTPPERRRLRSGITRRSALA